MLEDFPNPYPKPSFQFPVEVPPSDPDAAPTKTFAISCAWLPYIRGALQQLVLQATWKSLAPGDVALAQARAMTLISMFDECSGALPIACSQDWRGVSTGGWVNRNELAFCASDLGQFVPFIGWDANTVYCPAFNQTFAAVYIQKTFSPAITMSSFQLLYDLFKASGGVSDNAGVILFNGGSLVGGVIQDWKLFPDGAGNVLSSSFTPVTVDTVYIQMICDLENGNVGTSGSLRVSNFSWVQQGGSCQ